MSSGSSRHARAPTNSCAASGPAVGRRTGRREGRRRRGRRSETVPAGSDRIAARRPAGNVRGRRTGTFHARASRINPGHRILGHDHGLANPQKVHHPCDVTPNAGTCSEPGRRAIRNYARANVLAEWDQQPLTRGAASRQKMLQIGTRLLRRSGPDVSPAVGDAYVFLWQTSLTLPGNADGRRPFRTASSVGRSLRSSKIFGPVSGTATAGPDWTAGRGRCGRR